MEAKDALVLKFLYDSNDEGTVQQMWDSVFVAFQGSQNEARYIRVENQPRYALVQAL